MFTSDQQRQYGRGSLVCLLLLIGINVNVPEASAQLPVNASCSTVGQECLCDSSYENCRTPVLNLINNETVGIDVSFWFMTDYRYKDALIARWRAGVPVRVIVDTQADTNYPENASIRSALVQAGIPIRDCVSSLGINHWKAMIFAGQGKVQFSAANYANGSFSPSPETSPYINYLDEAIYFTGDSAIVQSFMRKFDDHWTDTSAFANLANISGPLTRNYDTYAIHSSLNFVPGQNFGDRLRGQVLLENQRIDAVIFRITSGKIPDALISRRNAGVPVRIVTDERQYRNTTYFWHAYNLDRMYAAGIEIKFKDRYVTEQDMHQKSIVLYSRALAVFGSSNWTSASESGQREHNYFTSKAWMVQWFKDQFLRKWNNLRADGSPIGTTVFKPFTPGTPAQPAYVAPANQSVGVGTTVTLRWEGGWWAHKYDIYVSTSSTPATSSAPIVVDYAPGSATAGVKSTKESYAISGLQPGTTYYWQIRGKTMANRSSLGPVWRFTTSGAAPPPPGSTLSPGDVVLYAGQATTRVGNWSVISDSTAAGGRRISNPNAGAATITTALANPGHYFEMQFTATADRAYRLWMRGQAASNSGYNDSVWVQFTNSVSAPGGGAAYRIGTTSAAWVNLQDCSGALLSGWGWQDNGYAGGTCGFLGPVIYFATTGTQRIRVQVREDGASFDQIVLSPDTFLNSSPGATRGDALILPAQNGSTQALRSSSGEVLYTASAEKFGNWSLVPYTTAAGRRPISNPNVSPATISRPAALSEYLEMQLTAFTDRAYRLRMRGKATRNDAT